MSENIILREKYISAISPYIGKNIITVLTGQRRVGKSSLLESVRNMISEGDKNANILYINKELFEFDNIRTGADLHEYLKPRLSKKKNNYLFIDEVQDIKDFEKPLREFLAKGNVDIYVTGSNAKMLSGDLASLLSGRYIETEVHSLVYPEFLLFHNLPKGEESFFSFIKYGGMPYLKNLELNNEIVYQYLSSIFDTILLKDIVARYNIRNIDFLIRLTEFLAENTGNLISAKKISDYLKSQKINTPPNTVVNYLVYLANSFFISKVKRIDLKGKKIFEINEKYYFGDVGIRNAVIGYRQVDISKILENILFLHLKYLGYEVQIGQMENREIDFVGTKGDRKIYIQVAYLLNKQDVINREFGNLLEIRDNYPKYVLSMDKFLEGNYKGIKQMNIIDFLTMSE